MEMALTANLSLWGLYQYDNSILDGLIVPTGMDADTVKDNLLLETNAMSILYPDPAFLKQAITVWAAERKDVWDKLYATTVLQYDPIENFDRTEDTEESQSGLSVRKNDQTRDRTSDAKSTDLRNQGGSNQRTDSQTAYNSNAFADTAKSESSGEDHVSSVGRSTGSENEAVSDNGQETRNDRRTYHSRIHGNIGIRSAQELIVQERDIALFCMTDFIINDFIGRFCVMVY